MKSSGTKIFELLALSPTFSDHKPLIFIFQGAVEGKNKLVRWALKLQGKGYVMKYVTGKANVLAPDF